MAGALFGASTANAAIGLKAGDWDIEFSGNINAFYTNASCETPGTPPATTTDVASGLACVSADDDVNVRTGLLPSWFGFSGKTRHNDLDVGVTIGFQPGVDGANQTQGGNPTGLDQALGLNASNFRQVFLTIGDKSWGTVKFGRDLGIFGSDAILSDMTLLGVGSGAGGGGGNTSLGRIGTGYVYADWKGQISYASPKMGGLSFALGLMDPFALSTLSGGALSGTADSLGGQANDTPGYEGKAVYEWGGGCPGKAWASFISQSVDTTTGGSFSAKGTDLGAKIGCGNAEVVVYAYDGTGIGTTAFLFDAADAAGNERDSSGGYVQLTYKIPGPNTKLGISVGSSELDRATGEAVSTLVEENKSTVFGIYHPLNKYVNLVLEFTKTESDAHNGNSAEEDSVAIGAILFY
jgi:predicted porin